MIHKSIQALWWKVYISYSWQQQEYLCLSYQLQVGSVVVAEMFHYHMLHSVVLLLLLVGPDIIFLLLPRIDIISHTSIITLKLFHKKVVNLPKLFSAPLVPCPHLPWYLCMLFVSTWSAFLCLMQCLASLIVYPKLCQRSNQLCSSTFWQTSIDFDRKSSISQVGCCCERRWNYRPRFSETWMFC